MECYQCTDGLIRFALSTRVVSRPCFTCSDVKTLYRYIKLTYSIKSRKKKLKQKIRQS